MRPQATNMFNEETRIDSADDVQGEIAAAA